MSRSRSCALGGIAEEKPAAATQRKAHFFSTGLSGVSFSWSFVMRGTLLSASRSSASSRSSLNSSSINSSWSSREYNGSSSVSRSVSLPVSSDSDVSGDSSESPRRSRSWGSKWPFGWRRKRHNRDKCMDQIRKDQTTSLKRLLDRLPFTESGKFLTVYVGVRSDQIVKYVVSRSLVLHPLVQVMLQVSESEPGHALTEGVSIVCDPELFLEVVRAVEGNFDSIRRVDPDEEVVVRTPAADDEFNLESGPR
ncbi:hypothetical protein R1flu_022406 [Riccia fluitans]|uniref:Uncharacterized protein n=1 Tax=Riccia fluitans TaxID=41844 RepID=A0ABD1ZS53_9MARC